jgi:hypothetical protein
MSVRQGPEIYEDFIGMIGKSYAKGHALHMLGE